MLQTKTKLLSGLAAFLLLVNIFIWTGGILNITESAFVPVPDNLCDGFPCGTGDNGVQIAQNAVGRVVDNVRYMIGAVAILIIVISGIKLVTASGNEEVLQKQITTLIYAASGLAVVGLAGEIAQILDIDRGGFLRDPNVALQRTRLFNKTVQIVITFLKYIIGSVSVFFIVRNVWRLVIAGDSDDEVTKDKKNILYGLAGLAIILFSNPIITKVFFKIDTDQFPGLEPVRPGIDTKRLAEEIAGVTNLVASITGPFALLSLVIGGVMYTFSAGEEEQTGKAKKIITWSIIGIVVIYGAFAVVSTIIARNFEGI